MKTFLKILLGIITIVIVAIVGLIIYVNTSYNKTFDVDYPSVQISTDSAVLARGEYLVYGPAHCANCHISLDQFEAVERGEKVPLSGGFTINMPFAKLRTPNITPDKETGIGNLRDEEIARTLRHNVNHKGLAIFPLMPFSQMSEYDLNAIISYIRQMEPVNKKVPETEYTFLGKVLKTFMLKPTPKQEIPANTDKSDPVAYGSYIANSVANCYGCHTELDEKKGVYVGEPFAGNMRFPSEFNPKRTFYTPNLTPDPETGRIAKWTEDQFVNRMRSGRVHADSPMPWGPFSRMSDEDLKAVYAYLMQLKPVVNKIENIVVELSE